jgi:hypothetical protein
VQTIIYVPLSCLHTVLGLLCRGGNTASAAAGAGNMRNLKSPSKPNAAASSNISASGPSGIAGGSSGAMPAVAAPSPNRQGLGSTGRGGRGGRGSGDTGPQSMGARGEHVQVELTLCVRCCYVHPLVAAGRRPARCLQMHCASRGGGAGGMVV